MTSYSPKLEYIKTIANNMKKNGQQLYYIIKDKQKSHHDKEITLDLKKFTLNLIETSYKLRKHEKVGTSIVFNTIILEIFSNYDADKSRNSKTRADFVRDSKFYINYDFAINSISIVSQNTKILGFDTVSMNLKSCIMKGHPYLIENLIEFHIKRLKTSLRVELLSLLGLISSMDFTPIKHVSEENFMRKTCQKAMHEFDKKLMTKTFLSYQDHHFLNKMLKNCPHCMLAYRKMCSSISFSIGDHNTDSTGGLEICLYNNISKTSMVSLHCSKILGILEERVFNTSLNMFSSEFKKNNDIKIKLVKKEKKRFDYNEISPLFSNIAHSATPKIIAVSGIFFEKSPLYLFLKFRKRKDQKIFDENL